MLTVKLEMNDVIAWLENKGEVGRWCSQYLSESKVDEVDDAASQWMI